LYERAQEKQRIDQAFNQDAADLREQSDYTALHKQLKQRLLGEWFAERKHLFERGLLQLDLQQQRLTLRLERCEEIQDVGTQAERNLQTARDALAQLETQKEGVHQVLAGLQQEERDLKEDPAQASTNAARLADIVLEKPRLTEEYRALSSKISKYQTYIEQLDHAIKNKQRAAAEIASLDANLQAIRAKIVILGQQHRDERQLQHHVMTQFHSPNPSVDYESTSFTTAATPTGLSEEREKT
jgi:chromosome segregation ATPase